MFKKIIANSFIICLLFSSMVLASDVHNTPQELRKAIITNDINNYIKIVNNHKDALKEAEGIDELVKLKFLNTLMEESSRSPLENFDKMKSHIIELQNKIDFQKLLTSKHPDLYASLKRYIGVSRHLNIDYNTIGPVKKKLADLGDYDQLAFFFITSCIDRNFIKASYYLNKLYALHSRFLENVQVNNGQITSETQANNEADLTICIAYMHAFGKATFKKDINKAYEMLRHALGNQDGKAVESFLLNNSKNAFIHSHALELMREFEHHGFFK